MLLAKFMTRLLKKHGYSDIVITFSDVHSRESRCCSPPSPPQIQNAACRHDHEPIQTVEHHAFTLPPAPSRSPLNSHRTVHIAKTRCSSPPSPPPPEIWNAACRHNHSRAKSFGGNITHSRIRHDRRSTRIETRHRQSDTSNKGNKPNSAP